MRIFLSAASNEFRSLRLKLAAMLLRSGIDVEHQEIFPQTTSDTVRKLGDLIKDSPLLIHIVGHIPGSIANLAAVSDLLDEIPTEGFLVCLPELRRDLGDFSGITYTQWEVFLALHYGVPVLLYAPNNACDPGTKTLRSDFAQKRHLERLLISRRYPEFCSDEADFVGKILADVYRHFGMPEGWWPPATPRYLPERNPRFRGRKADIARLRHSLSQSTTIGITQQVAVFASGGVGKSSLALEFAWDCFASSSPRYPGGVFWCDCRSRDVTSLADELAALAAPLGINSGDNDDPMPTALKVRDRLALGPPSLLILDSVVDSEQWKSKAWNDLLPGGSCHRLLTTRAESLGDQRMCMLSLACLSEPDARALLHSYRQDVALVNKRDAVKGIIDWFGGLAIGLTVVGVYLGIHSTVTWDAYWQSLRKRRLNTVRDTEDLASPADYSGRVDSVIDDIFHSQSPAEQQALLYVSILPGEDVSNRWLIELLTDDLLTKRISGSTPPGYSSLPHAILAGLIRRAILIRLIETPTRKTVFLHQVVRERFRELLQRDPARSRELSAHVRELATRLYHRSRQWTRAIAESTDFAEAQQLLASMVKAECDPDVYTFTALVSKASAYNDAKGVIAQMKAAGHKPTLATFNTLLSKADNYDDATAVVVEMEAANESPDAFTFNTLLWKADTFQEAKHVVKTMEAAGVEASGRGFNRLLSHARNLEEALPILDQMQAKGHKPGLFLLTKLLWTVHTYSEAQAVVTEIRAIGGTLDEDLLRVLLSKAKTADEIKSVAKQIAAAGIQLGTQIFNRQVSTAATYEGAAEILMQMKAAGEKPSFVTFNRLLSQTRTDEEAISVVRQMQTAGVQLKASTFKALLSKKRTEEEVTTFIDSLRMIGALPDAAAFKRLLLQGRTNHVAKRVLAQLGAAGVHPEGSSLKGLLSIAETYAEAKDIVGQVLAAGGKPDEIPFASVFSKQNDLPPIGEVLSWYYGLPYHPSSPLNALIGSLRRLNRIEEAMIIVLQHPHLSAAPRLMRDFPKTAEEVFQSAKVGDTCHPTADLALGILATETNRPSDARAHLEEALRRANHPKKVETIQLRLTRLG